MTKSRAGPRRTPTTTVKAKFRLSRNVVKAIGEEFNFKLTAQEVAQLEVAAGKAINDRRRAFQRGPRDDFHRALATTKIRRAKIVKLVDQLRRLLDDDKRAEEFWRLSLSNAVGISPNGTMLRLEDAPSFLEYIKWLTQQHPLEGTLDLDKGKEQRKRKNADCQGWDILILNILRIFQNRGLPWTANYSRKTRAYSSRLLRGLYKVHDALPADVQAASALALGSPTAERIKKIKAGARRQSPERNDVLVHQGNIARS